MHLSKCYSGFLDFFAIASIAAAHWILPTWTTSRLSIRTPQIFPASALHRGQCKPHGTNGNMFDSVLSFSPG